MTSQEYSDIQNQFIRGGSIVGDESESSFDERTDQRHRAHQDQKINMSMRSDESSNSGKSEMDAMK